MNTIYEVHPLAAIIPAATVDEKEKLATDIRENGCCIRSSSWTG